MHRFLLGVALLGLGFWLPSNIASAQYGVTAAPPTYVAPACPPVISPPPVVVEPPRRCCILRLCDWMCGRPAPQPTVVAMPVVPAQPVCPPTLPSCGCNPCACGNCQTMPAPSLTSYNAAPATYTASAPTTYQAAYPAQQGFQVQQTGYTPTVTTFQPIQQVVYPTTSRRAPPRWPGP
jgi:hypothetical protein